MNGREWQRAVWRVSFLSLEHTLSAVGDCLRACQRALYFPLCSCLSAASALPYRTHAEKTGTELNRKEKKWKRKGSEWQRPKAKESKKLKIKRREQVASQRGIERQLWCFIWRSYCLFCQRLSELNFVISERRALRLHSAVTLNRLWLWVSLLFSWQTFLVYLNLLLQN